MPPQASQFVTLYQNISSGFAQAASELAAQTPTEGSFIFLATSFANLEQAISTIGMPEYILATPYLGETANYLNDVALQVGLGLNSAEEQVTFLQDWQSLGVSLVDCGQSIEEPIAPPWPVGGFWDPVDKFGLLAPYIGLALTIVVATVATAIYAKRRKEKR